MSTDPKALITISVAELDRMFETSATAKSFYLGLRSRSPAAAGVDRERLTVIAEHAINDLGQNWTHWECARRVVDALLSSGILGESAQAADLAPAGNKHG